MVSTTPMTLAAVPVLVIRGATKTLPCCHDHLHNPLPADFDRVFDEAATQESLFQGVATGIQLRAASDCSLLILTLCPLPQMSSTTHSRDFMAPCLPMATLGLERPSPFATGRLARKALCHGLWSTSSRRSRTPGRRSQGHSSG